MLKRMKRHIFSLVKCIEKLKFVHFFEKISVNQHHQSSASPVTFGQRSHRLADTRFPRVIYCRSNVTNFKI